MEEFKEIELLEEGELVDIPDLENNYLIEENTMSVIVRCLNPVVHKVYGLVKALPPIWRLEDSVRGRGVGEDRFFFQNERDLHHVLTRGPWFVNGWIVSLDQWSPTPGPDFLCKIPFLIIIRGIPVHLLKKQAIEFLLGPLGKVEKVELHAKNSSSVEYVRAQVWINTKEPLQFRRIARFKSGEVVPTELEYEKLIKVCFMCKRLTHDRLYCPLQEGLAAEPPTSRRRDGGGSFESGRGKQNVPPTGTHQRCVVIARSSSTAAGSGRGNITSSEQTPRSSGSQELRVITGRKGKGIRGEVQTFEQRGAGSSKSRGETSGPRSRRSPFIGRGNTGGSSGASQTAPSVFCRLGEKESTEAIGGEIVEGAHIDEVETPSVFERLGRKEPSSSSGKKGEWLDLVGRREEDSVGVMRDFLKRLKSVRKLKIRTHISLRG
ncbi:LOW QUALITY PROTEIN: hypothetical protein YC2023_008614 [Brassica napus]